MYYRSSRFLTLAAVVAGLGVTASEASAQQASFRLPFEAHWGQAVLEPGDYKLSAPLGVSGTYMIHVNGAGESSVIVPAVTQVQPSEDRGYLELVKVNGTYFVKRYKAAFSGQVFQFGLPKAERAAMTTSPVARTISVRGGTQ